MTSELHEQGFAISENRVARLMQREGIHAQRKRAFRPKTTIQDDSATSRIAPNRLAQLPEIDAPGQAIVGDITLRGNAGRMALSCGCHGPVQSIDHRLEDLPKHDHAARSPQ